MRYRSFVTVAFWQSSCRRMTNGISTSLTINFLTYPGELCSNGNVYQYPSHCHCNCYERLLDRRAALIAFTPLEKCDSRLTYDIYERGARIGFNLISLTEALPPPPGSVAQQTRISSGARQIFNRKAAFSRSFTTMRRSRPTNRTIARIWTNVDQAREGDPLWPLQGRPA